jgi:MYXO-CTERM domain-containing protein
VFAVDLAGNRSEPVSATVASECGGVLDAGADGLSVGDVPIDSSPAIDGQGSIDKPIVIVYPPDATMDIARPDVGTQGTGGTAGNSGTGGTAGMPGSGGVVGIVGSGGGSGAPLTGNARYDASADRPEPSDSGCSCRVGGDQGGGAGFVLLALGVLLTRRLRRRR